MCDGQTGDFSMKNIAQHLKEDFERELKKIPSENSFASPLLSYKDVLRAHYLICDYFESITKTPSVFGVRSMDLLGSAIGRQRTEFSNHNKWQNEFEVMATLFFGLTKNHAFHDGNKRTALLCLLYQLYKYGRVPIIKQDSLEQLTVDIADGTVMKRNNFNEFFKKSGKTKKDISVEDQNVYYIASYIKKYSRKLDSSYKTLTYEEFNTVLRKFDCCLDEPSKNYINVYKNEVVKHFLKKDEIKKRKVLQIGFPGWKKQVNSKALKESLKALELTPDKGFDNSVLFQEAEPLYKIIQDYEGPLSRLKDK